MYRGQISSNTDLLTDQNLSLEGEKEKEIEDHRGRERGWWGRGWGRMGVKEKMREGKKRGKSESKSNDLLVKQHTRSHTMKMLYISPHLHSTALTSTPHTHPTQTLTLPHTFISNPYTSG